LRPFFKPRISLPSGKGNPAGEIGLSPFPLTAYRSPLSRVDFPG
jgi:hypothetical protein